MCLYVLASLREREGNCVRALGAYKHTEKGSTLCLQVARIPHPSPLSPSLTTPRPSPTPRFNHSVLHERLPPVQFGLVSTPPSAPSPSPAPPTCLHCSSMATISNASTGRTNSDR